MAVIVKRNRLQMEETDRNTAVLALKALVQAKKGHLERLTQYYESLRSVSQSCINQASLNFLCYPQPKAKVKVLTFNFSVNYKRTVRKVPLELFVLCTT